MVVLMKILSLLGCDDVLAGK